MNRKPDTSLGAGGQTAAARALFDAHLDVCHDCQFCLCLSAEQLWRYVCLASLEQHQSTTGGAR